MEELGEGGSPTRGRSQETFWNTRTLLKKGTMIPSLGWVKLRGTNTREAGEQVPQHHVLDGAGLAWLHTLARLHRRGGSDRRRRDAQGDQQGEQGRHEDSSWRRRSQDARPPVRGSQFRLSRAGYHT